MVDEAFKGCGKKLGLEIWRIEKMKVVPVAPQTYGQFYTGDSYIVLSTKKNKDWNIHFWLGNETSQDEAGVAAYKTVELDDFLGGAPAQHREVQGHESKMFQSYFSKGLQYLAGGIESGFKKVVRDKYEPRLLHVKGHRNIRVQETRLAWTSMISGDVFILDEGLTIWVWNGKGAGRMEKIKGLDIARRIRDEERSGKAKLEIVEEENPSRSFIKRMTAVSAEGTPQDVQPPIDDHAFERQSRELIKLYRVSDASGKLEVKQAGSFPLKKELLDTKDAFILDTGSGGIFVWLGRGATKNEKKAAFKNAVDFVQSKGYPSWTNVSCMKEGFETPLFQQNFSNWVSKEEKKGSSTSLSKKGSSTSASKKEAVKEKFDVAAMQECGKRKPQVLVDDGTGKVEIWRIENFEPQPVNPELYGQFYSGDCYIILYTYLQKNKKKYILYFWLGQESSPDERGAAAAHVIALDEKYGGTPVQVRVVQNKEPDQFLLIFKGKMVVHSGGIPSGFKNRKDKDSRDTDSPRLFHVRGTDDINCRAVQVEGKSSSLNSNDCFILECPAGTFIWYGKGCSGDERHLADSIAGAVIKKKPEKVTEGKEPAAFWEALGGKTEYASDKWLEEVLPSNPPRLFQCSNATGKIRVEEIFDFAQLDLVPEDVMILDTYHDIFVWVGRGANKEEKKQSLTIATDYIKSDPSGRDLDSTSVVQVKQGFEPVMFTCNFLAWNPEFWSQEQSYEEYMKSVDIGIVSASEEMKKYDDSRKYTFKELQKDPEGIDLTRKEMYLTEEDFKKVLGISVSEYKALPTWKQDDLKKKVGLF